MLIRRADPEQDAAACLAIYTPFVTDAVTSFEATPPRLSEFAERITRYSRTHPYLVAEEDGKVIGFAYGSPYRERAAYRWTAETSIYVDPAHHGRGVGKSCTSDCSTCFEPRASGRCSPARRSPTTRASHCIGDAGSCRSASSPASAGSSAAGTTSRGWRATSARGQIRARSTPRNRDLPIILVTGIQAAGKSTIAQALVQRLDRSVHVRGICSAG